ncbi:MAG: hypothetical protein UY24_C0015G0010 [Parcubacteria group bacterium GW2011_GWA1_48_11b]|uniref:Uncharacterized protein n=3 Tax=Parcubacteria group TaxID=1794811 RepID=A0A1G2H7K8_9BACT|nr:MAG: hypothetical protein UX74_C0001G0017 [Parcubacteria group bacterium GW2011_GWA2_47_10b]KKU75583.1 MAG: hypothetical protein UY02_C0047G0004 [Candidatus Giovannonibacteria bacterium GW2011_GWB1_47_6b]KKU94419.1 MAG: hypothetical protein UY24_C0015G0010 [Parcubacteria group bacterium GW2011_GWA1_48_11b]OGZ50682.1 MAG: hypothetical protein A3C83_02945 [Candidatus Ryanbacteria bacterium RIFCSPHIGHO2_02_FULL_47_25]OGZ53026.1 MAG: hypothetical protein A3F26_01150 [Candidatus Ryanbacteria bact
MEEKKKDTPRTEISWTVIFSILALGFSIYTHQQLLPVQQSNVTFSEAGVEVINEDRDDRILPKFKNVGRAAAKDVRLSILFMSMNKTILWDESNRIVKLFDSELIHDLEPESEVSFGKITVEHIISNSDGNNNTYNLADKQSDVVFVFCLQYKDALSSNALHKKIFLFHYIVGTPHIFSLISDDYSKIKNDLARFILDGKAGICALDKI